MKFFILIGLAAVKAWWGGRENFVCMPCGTEWPATGPVVCVQFERRGQSVYQDELLSHCPAPSENRS